MYAPGTPWYRLTQNLNTGDPRAYQKPWHFQTWLRLRASRNAALRNLAAGFCCARGLGPEVALVWEMYGSCRAVDRLDWFSGCQALLQNIGRECVFLLV